MRGLEHARTQGQTGTRLELDGVRGENITQIAWWCAWAKSSVYEILRNPKYTGYQVFNRRAMRSRGGKVNDPALWVCRTNPHMSR